MPKKPDLVCESEYGAINNLYTLPTTGGIEGDVLTKSAGTAAIWKDPSNKGIYSQIAPVTNANTTTETTMNGFGAGSLTIPAGTVFLGSSFRYSTEEHFGIMLTIQHLDLD